MSKFQPGNKVGKLGRPTDQQKGIKCPTCGGGTYVVDSRLDSGRETLRRRRRCMDNKCPSRFTTVEIAVESDLAGQGSSMLEKLAKRMLAKKLHELADALDAGGFVRSQSG
jgi:hypothetical protein